MKWTTLDYIHQHSRIDYNCEDASLELYGIAAEDTILNLLECTYEDLINKYGEIPAAIRQATLMLVEVSYSQRSPVSPQSLYVVPYTFDTLIKPYMRLADSDTSDNSRLTSVVLGSDFKLTLAVVIDEDVTLSDINFTVDIINNDQQAKSVTIAKADCIVDDEDDTITVVLNSDDLGIGLLLTKVTLQVPDEDYPNGIRRVAQRINPYTRIVG